MRRVRVLQASLLILLTAGIITAGVGAWLARWIPTHGKAWVATQLEHLLPLDITIDQLHYSLWDGITIEQLRGINPAAPTVTWLEMPHLHLRVGLLRLALRQEVAFRLSGTLQAPLVTTATMAGVYHLRTHQLTIDLQTADISLGTISPALRRYVPSTFTDGQLILHLKAEMHPSHPALVAINLIGHGLVWQQAPLRLTTNLDIDGTAQTSASGEETWRYDLTAHMREGHLTGVPLVQELSGITGTLHLTPDHLEIASMTGRALDDTWTLQGDLAPLSDPVLDAMLRTHINLAGLPLKELAAWQPSGASDLRVVVRGPLRQWPSIEMLASADVQDAALTIPALAMRADHLQGHLTYDHLTHQLELQPLKGQLPNSRVRVEGTATLQKIPLLNVRINADADMALLNAWPAIADTIGDLSGPVTVDATIRGLLTQPTLEGTAILRGATIHVTNLPQPLEAITGTIAFSPSQWTTQGLTMRVADQSLRLAGTITQNANATPLNFTVTFADGSVAVQGFLQPDQFRIDRAEAALGDSHLTLRGVVATQPARPSHLMLDGVVDPSDLAHLPWLKLPAFTTWKIYGPASVTLELTGPLQNWHTATIQGNLRAEALTIRELPVRAINVDVNQADGQLSVRLLQAFIADGKLVGHYVLDTTRQPPESALECDLTQADLTQLAASIPTWHDRGINGAVSGHMRILGPLSRQSQLVGDGWVRAAGAHLGDMPFLEKTFKGFFGELAQRLGLGIFRTAEITEMTAQWRLSNGRLSTEDLRFNGVTGTEPISILMHGSAGLDQTLDLTVEPDFSEQLLLESPTVPSATRTLLKTVGRLEQVRRLIGRHHLGGTLDKPEYKFEVSLDQILKQLLRGGLGQLF